MIVRNEGNVIRRCLESVRSLISYWAISDTGSSDGTKQIIRDTLRGVPGELHDDRWINFGHNRTINIERARGKADYLLLMNADEILNVNGSIPELRADAYLLRYEGDFDYHAQLLVRGDREWHYVGATHEHIDSETPCHREKLPALTITHFRDGGMRADKYERDIDLLEKEVAAKPDNSRAVFYLAQSYRDIGNLARAMELYERRTTMEGWEEETWCAAYQVARMRHLLGMAWPLVLDAYLAAYSYRPTRLEPLYHIAKYHRLNNEPALTYLYSRPVVDTPYPDDLLFIERNTYEYLLPFEYALSCAAIGKHNEAARISAQLLVHPSLPTDLRETLKFASQTVGPDS